MYTMDYVLGWPIVNGYHVEPTSDIVSPVTVSVDAFVHPSVKIGKSAFIGKDVEVNYCSIIGKGATLQDGCVVMNNCVIGGYSIVQAGAVVGELARLGKNASVGANTRTGNYLDMGNESSIGDNSVVGEKVTIGNFSHIGNNCRIGDGIVVSIGFIFGDGFDSLVAEREFAASFPEESIFWKWVTKDRMSPCFDGGTMLYYGKHDIVEADGVVSDQQCAEGLHVVRIPYRPEYVGLCYPGHNYIPLRVLVKKEDILFAGLPGMDAKLRVRKLYVLD